ncbi:glycosyltransferase [Providencia sp. wls1919]|nr:glycosyltransferase [Providencia sp. wls1919]
MMKIINISPIWFHKGEGISEVAINHYLSFLNIGIESKLIQTNFHQAIKLPIKNNFLFEIAKNKADKPKSIINLLRLIYRERESIFIIHGMFQIRMLLVMIFLFIMKQRYIVIPHSSLSSKAFKSNSYIKPILYKFLIFYLLKRSEFVMYLNSDEMKNGVYTCKNIAVFPNGISINKTLNKNPPHIEKNTNNKAKLIYLGRYDIKHKGLDYLLNFSKYLTEHHPSFNWELNMYGSDSKNGLNFISEYIAENNLSSYIKIHDAVFGENKDKVFSKADVFILSSRYEGMPITILEALSHGLPCLLTKETNMLSILKDAEIAEEFYPENFEMTFTSLNQLIEKITDDKFQERCFKLVEKNYSWDSICQEIVNKLSK